MDQNSKRDRDKKLKRDKRSKDVKRSHPSKSETKSTSELAQMSKKQTTLTKPQEQVLPTDCIVSSETEKSNDESNLVNSLKRETDAIAEINKSFSKRQITSNWSKYETPLALEDNDIMNKGADFEYLLSAPISEGGHFKFKSEKMWSSNPSDYSNLFSLDLKHLARGLACIPFYEQVDVPRDNFSAEALDYMENEVKQSSAQLKSSSNEIPSNFFNTLKSSLTELKISSEESSDLENHSKLDNLFLSKEKNKASSIVDTPLSEKPTNYHVSLQCEKDTSPSKSLEADTNLRTILQQPLSSSEVNSTSISVNEVNTHSVTTTEDNDSKKAVQDLCVPSSKEDDELDFLLSLKEPITSTSLNYTDKVLFRPEATPNKIDIQSMDEGAVSLSNKDETEDLESWLDSILD